MSMTSGWIATIGNWKPLVGLTALAAIVIGVGSVARGDRQHPPTSLFAGIDGAAERRIALLAITRAREMTAAADAALAAACDDFVSDFPDHPHAFNYALRAQDIRGVRDLDALRVILDRASDRVSTQFAHNTISLATILMESGLPLEALERCEAALAMPACPKDRRGEAWVLIGMIFRGTDDSDRSRAAFREARLHTDRFPAIEGELLLLDLESGVVPSPLPAPPAEAVSVRQDLKTRGVTGDQIAWTPIRQVVFQDHVVSDRARLVCVLAETCHAEHSIELRIGMEGMSSAIAWPTSGTRQVANPAWISMGAIAYQDTESYGLVQLDPIDDVALVRSTRRGWITQGVRVLPLVESGVIARGCEGE